MLSLVINETLCCTGTRWKPGDRVIVGGAGCTSSDGRPPWSGRRDREDLRVSQYNTANAITENPSSLRACAEFWIASSIRLTRFITLFIALPSPASRRVRVGISSLRNSSSPKVVRICIPRRMAERVAKNIFFSLFFGQLGHLLSHVCLQWDCKKAARG